MYIIGLAIGGMIAFAVGVGFVYFAYKFDL